MEIEIFLTSEAARAAGVSTQTIRAWLRSGILPAQRTQGGVHLIRRTDLFRVLAERSR